MTDVGRVVELVSDLLGAAGPDRRVRSASPLSGGDIGEAWRVETTQGSVFAKTMVDAPPGFFATEAAGLAWLAEPGVLEVPEVIGYSDEILVLAFIEAGRATRQGAARFGAGLAELHAAGASGFGATPPGGQTAGFLARLGVHDHPVGTWREFFVTQRLEPLLSEAERRNALPEGAPGTLQRLIGLLRDPADELGGPEEPPARLHGDLWGGNVIWGEAGNAWLIDPASHGGHRETDLAMMRLFGGFDPTVFAAYGEVAPLADGWQRRVGLHQLPPLLVHACLFGGAYGARVAQVVTQLL